MQRFVIILFLPFIVSCDTNHQSNQIKPRNSIDSLAFAKCLSNYFENESKRVVFAEYFLTFKSDTVDLDEYLESEKRLILFLPKYACTLCCYNQIELLKKHLSDSVMAKTIIIANFHPSRDLFVFWKDQMLPVPFIYNCEFNIIPKSIDTSRPSLFLINESMIIDLLFTPISGNDTLTGLYLEGINNRF